MVKHPRGCHQGTVLVTLYKMLEYRVSIHFVACYLLGEASEALTSDQCPVGYDQDCYFSMTKFLHLDSIWKRDQN